MKQFVLATWVVSMVCATQIATASAAIAPETVEKMKRKAPNVVNVEILEEKQGIASPQGRMPVEYRAKVLGVTKSESGVKVGDTITIHFDIIVPTKAESKEDVLRAAVDLIGPAQPKRLPKNWNGKVYLSTSDTQGRFGIAAFGHSFDRE